MSRGAGLPVRLRGGGGRPRRVPGEEDRGGGGGRDGAGDEPVGAVEAECRITGAPVDRLARLSLPGRLRTGPAAARSRPETREIPEPNRAPSRRGAVDTFLRAHRSDTAEKRPLALSGSPGRLFG
ncbi:hypothetical protein ABH917_001273 [Thermobifida halotolerans]